MATRRQDDGENTSAESASAADAFTREELLRRGGAAAVAIGLSGAFVAPASAFSPTLNRAQSRMSELARAVLRHPRVISRKDTKQGALVLAIKDELLVLRGPELVERQYPRLSKTLQQFARLSTTLRDCQKAGLPPGYDVEVWRITNLAKDAFVRSRELRKSYKPVKVVFPSSTAPVTVALVQPNHISIVSGYDMCPDGPPRVASAEGHPQIPAYSPENSVNVVVIDTGFVRPKQKGNHELSGRGGIMVEQGRWPDTSVEPGVWRRSGADGFKTYRDALGLTRLSGVAGHGTFVTGILAANCKHAHITIVGHRHAVMPIPVGGTPTGVDAQKLFASEMEIVCSVLTHVNKQVICCGFAFPTLDGYDSFPFDMVLPRLNGDTTMLAPAGNEDTDSRYWPAAHERVIGVAATDEAGTAKADFSNWGDWINCCSPGVNAISTFGYVTAIPQDVAAVSGTPTSHFEGWAFWNGTCFATPIVAARIASEAAKRNVTPMQAWSYLRERAQFEIQLSETTRRPFISAGYPW